MRQAFVVRLLFIIVKVAQAEAVPPAPGAMLPHDLRGRLPAPYPTIDERLQEHREREQRRLAEPTRGDVKGKGKPKAVSFSAALKGSRAFAAGLDGGRQWPSHLMDTLSSSIDTSSSSRVSLSECFGTYATGGFTISDQASSYLYIQFFFGEGCATSIFFIAGSPPYGHGFFIDLGEHYGYRHQEEAGCTQPHSWQQEAWA